MECNLHSCQGNSGAILQSNTSESLSWQATLRSASVSLLAHCFACYLWTAMMLMGFLWWGLATDSSHIFSLSSVNTNRRTKSPSYLVALRMEAGKPLFTPITLNSFPWFAYKSLLSETVRRHTRKSRSSFVTAQRLIQYLLGYSLSSLYITAKWMHIGNVLAFCSYW